jgi:hypothetical protein
MPIQRSRSNERGLKKKNTHKPTSVMTVGEVMSIMHHVQRRAVQFYTGYANVEVRFQDMILFFQGVSQPQRIADTVRLQFMGLKIFVSAANSDVYFSMLLLLVVLFVFFTLVIKDLLLQLTCLITTPITDLQIKIHYRIPLGNSRIDHIIGKTSPYDPLFLIEQFRMLVTFLPVFMFIVVDYYCDEEV